MGDWRPSAENYKQLLLADDDRVQQSRPYPFFLASPIADEEAFFESSDFDPASYLFEWKWDGIRAQIIKRGGEIFIFSRGEELVTDQFPEVAREAARLPGGTVLDGEILAFRDNDVMPFSALQKRIGRKAVGKKLLEDVPVIFMAFDLLEQDGEDLRSLPLSQRRYRLLSLLTPGALDEAPSCRMAFSSTLRVSSAIESSDMQQLRAMRQMSRDIKVEGLMLKKLDSIYGVGRKRGDWWKWKIDPFTCDAVLMYAQAGHGRRANLYTDYTFGVWQGDRLVPIAKAYSGLTDQEIRNVDAFIRANTLEKFGPVRTVRPQLVFELAFEGIQASKRHKAGLALRFPRMARWRTDKKAEEADTLANLEALLAQ
jgi:DNA ligase-1